MKRFSELTQAEQNDIRNATYVAIVVELENGYRLRRPIDGVFHDDCIYVIVDHNYNYNCVGCNTCTFCLNCTNCKYTHSCTDCTDCNHCGCCNDCRDCNDCEECVGCTDCLELCSQLKDCTAFN